MAERTEEQIERIRLIVQLRRERYTQRDIADMLGMSQQRVSQLYREALADMAAPDLAEHRAEELALIDDAIRALIGIAQDPAHPRTAVEAWSAARAWADRKARLLGLDAPRRTEVKIADDSRIDQEIEALVAQLAATPARGAAEPSM